MLGPWQELAIAGLAERVSKRIIPAARMFQPLLNDNRADGAPIGIRLAPEAVVRLGRQNDISTLVLDINDRIEIAAMTARAAAAAPRARIAKGSA
ncbi:MAG: hypothetical protein H0V72_01745 [Bradyrhizobium sp.]|nr:hypothetical protein [Bradyrhizobium sp.]